MRLLIVLIALTGCAVQWPAATGPDRLAAHIEGRVAGEPQACLSTSALTGKGLEVIDGATLVYRSGDTVWVNRLEHVCPGMRPLATVIVEGRAGRYCRGDSVTALDAGADTPRQVCQLGEFTPYRRP